MSIKTQNPHIMPCIITAFILFGGLARWPYGYYQLLRWITCAAAVFVAFTAYQWQKIWAVWVFGFVAVLFNPLVPIHLSREIWQPIDAGCALLFFVIAFVLKKPTEERQQGK